MRVALRLARALVRIPKRALRFLGEWRRYNHLNTQPSMRARLRSLYPIISDYDGEAGFHNYYFHQDLWAARKIYQVRPASHVDVGSRIDGFIAHLLVFMPVSYVDIRPLHGIADLHVIHANAIRLDGFETGSVPSLSSLNAAEHFGLGRYSDPIDPTACYVSMESLVRVLALGGRPYFATPIGRERVEFNAHRIFALETILEAFAELRLVSFSYVDGDDQFHEDVHPGDFPRECEFAKP